MRTLVSLIIVVTFFFSCGNQQSQNSSMSKISYKDISTTDAKIKLVTNKSKFLDVRTPAEIAEGKIANAIEMDFRASDFKNRLESLDKNSSYVVYCRSGGRSAKAAKIMTEAGFKDVYNMKGGYSDWPSLN